MSSKRGEKRTYVTISSSSSEDDDFPLSESDYTDQPPDIQEISSSSSSYDDDDDNDEEEDDDDGEREGSCDRVIRRLRDKGDLHELKLRDCHSYLRQHGLRMTGTKTECVERIMTHWRIKDGNAEALYPRSSFVLDCTGDVCRGDVVLFKQRVKMFNKKRSKQFPFIRTVAGRVIRESYGAGKQQHTFTIEVLWSKSCKGAEQLLPLSYLLVKGRKLYRMRTFRQLWNNESRRHEVLAEKHERGDTARLVRAMNRGMEKGFSKSKGIKCQKQALHATPSTSGKRADAKRENRGKAKKEKVKSTKNPQKAPPENLKKKSMTKASESSTKHRNSINLYKKQCSIAQSYPYPSQSFPRSQMQPNLPFHPHHPFHNYDPNLQFSRFSPQIFHQRQLHPNLSHISPNYQDTNSQSYPYAQHNFHPSQIHHDVRDIRAHFHNPQSFQQSQMQYHHQPWNADGVSPHYVSPPIIQVSQKQRFEPYLR